MMYKMRSVEEVKNERKSRRVSRTLNLLVRLSTLPIKLIVIVAGLIILPIAVTCNYTMCEASWDRCFLDYASKLFKII